MRNISMSHETIAMEMSKYNILTNLIYLKASCFKIGMILRLADC